MKWIPGVGWCGGGGGSTTGGSGGGTTGGSEPQTVVIRGGCGGNLRCCPYPDEPCPLMGRKAGRKPHICPVCNGAGRLNDYTAVGWSGTAVPTRPCHACDGKGVVWG